MTSQMAEQIKGWLRESAPGEGIEVSRAWLENIIHELEFTAAGFASAERAVERRDEQIERLEAAAANREYRRAS